MRDELGGLFGRIDMRHHDAPAAAVERPRRHVELAVRHAHDRRNTGVERRHRNLRARIERHRAMLEIDEQPIPAAAFYDAPDLGPARQAQAATDRDLAPLQRHPRRVLHISHSFSPSLPRVLPRSRGEES
jgi:hypothetical protein